MSLSSLRRAARTNELFRATPFSRLASVFVPCGEGFAPKETASRAFSRSRDRPGGRVKRDCAKTVVLADAGHGVGRALLASLLAYPDCRLTVAAATPSADLVASLRNQHWQECEALQCEVSVVDLGDDADVKRWRERVLFTHGTPDVVIANVGGMPLRWLRAYGEKESGTDGVSIRDDVSEDEADLDRFAAWLTEPADWSRLMNDVKGVGNVARQFLPAMVQAAREEASCLASSQADDQSVKKHQDEGFTSNATTDAAPYRLPSRAFIIVSHVVDPPAGARIAPYEASHAALAAVTRSLAADARNVFDTGELETKRRAFLASAASNASNAKKKERKSENGGSGGVVVAQVGPGRIPGLALERDGADVGPLHKTHGDALAADWAHAAVPFMLQMTHDVAGKTLHVPGFR